MIIGIMPSSICNIEYLDFIKIIIMLSTNPNPLKITAEAGIAYATFVIRKSEASLVTYCSFENMPVLLNKLNVFSSI